MQLTCNSSSGEFAAQDLNVLRQIFDRFLVFLAGLSKALGAEGVSATMERASPLQARAEDQHSCQGVLWLVLLVLWPLRCICTSVPFGDGAFVAYYILYLSIFLFSYVSNLTKSDLT